MANPFDQFDTPQANPFDQFDPKPERDQKSERKGPPDLFIGPVTRAISAIPGALESAGKHAKGLITGEIPPTPENVLPAASLAIGASPVRLGLGSVTHAPKPRAPIATTPDELQEAATLAAIRPTGAVVPQAEAGAAVRRAAETKPAQPSVDEWLAQAGPARTRVPSADDWITGARTPGDDWIAGLAPRKPVGELGPWGPRAAEAAAEAPTARARLISQGRVPDERIVAHLVDEAEQGGHAALAHFRKITPAEDWAKVQGASLGYLGRTGELGGQLGYDAITALQRYRDLPDKGKGLLFGEPVTVAGQKLQAGIRPHLDSLVADAERLGKLTEAGVKEAAPLPMEALVRILGMSGETLLRVMGQPSAAASIAHWSRAYARIIEQGKTPAAIAALTIATRNLENTIGSAEAAETKSIADINKPLPEEEEARRRIRERLLSSGRTELPIEKMRQSTMVQDRRGVTPPRPDVRDLLPRQPFLATGDFRRRILGEIPIGPMETDAGVPDIRPRRKR